MSEPEPHASPWRTLVVVVLLAALVGGGVLLAQRMAASGRVEDCLMAGRRNCGPSERIAP